MAATKRVTVSITVSGGSQSFLVNTTPSDATAVRWGASATGLDGTGSDIDFLETQYPEVGSATNIPVAIGGQLSLTTANPQKTIAGVALTSDHLIFDFEPNDATTGTIIVTITFIG